MPSTGISSAMATSMRPSSAAVARRAPAGRGRSRLGAVAGWVDVGAAGQQQAVEAADVVGRVDVLGQVHRQPAGRGDRPGVVADVDVEIDVGQAAGEPGDVGADLAPARQADQRTASDGGRSGGHSDPNDIPSAAAVPCRGSDVCRRWHHGAVAVPRSRRRRARSWPTTWRPGSGPELADVRRSSSGCPAAACRWRPRSPTRLGGELDVLTVRKIGAPYHHELAIGAVASGGLVVLNDEVIAHLGVRPRDVERADRRRPPRAGRPGAPASAATGRARRSAGRTVVVVDDGLATGATMRAAVGRCAPPGRPRVVVAVPVGAPESCAELGDAGRRSWCARCSRRLRRRRRVVRRLLGDHRRRRAAPARRRPPLTPIWAGPSAAPIRSTHGQPSRRARRRRPANRTAPAPRRTGRPEAGRASVAGRSPGSSAVSATRGGRRWSARVVRGPAAASSWSSVAGDRGRRRGRRRRRGGRRGGRRRRRRGRRCVVVVVVVVVASWSSWSSSGRRGRGREHDGGPAAASRCDPGAARATAVAGRLGARPSTDATSAGHGRRRPAVRPGGDDRRPAAGVGANVTATPAIGPPGPVTPTRRRAVGDGQLGERPRAAPRRRLGVQRGRRPARRRRSRPTPSAAHLDVVALPHRPARAPLGARVPPRQDVDGGRLRRRSAGRRRGSAQAR